MQPTQERWRPVIGYEGCYEVSDQGRVRSLERWVRAGMGRVRKSPARILSIHTGDHYSKVRLKRDGDGKTFNVHSLVTAAFLGPVPDGMEVCHNNGKHHDNRLSNLRYDTHQENQRDQVRHGSNPWSKRTHCHAGHEYTPETTFIRSTGARGCQPCVDTYNMRRREQHASK